MSCVRLFCWYLPMIVFYSVDLDNQLFYSLIKVCRFVKRGLRKDFSSWLSLFEKCCWIHLLSIYCPNLLFIEPFFTSAIFPKTILEFVFLFDKVGADAMLFSHVPITTILAFIGPCINAVPVLFVVLVLSFVFSSVVPDIYPHTWHVVIEPLSLVLATIDPCVNSYAGDFVFFPFTLVEWLIVP